MPVWEWAIIAMVLLLAAVVALGLGFVVRRLVLARHGGTFELSCRLRDARPGHGWVLGVGRYSGEELEWFRFFSVSPRPRKVWHRKTMEYAGRRPLEGDEALTLYADHVVVRCDTADGPIELAMSEPTLTGFQSWVESGPPGAEIR